VSRKKLYMHSDQTYRSLWEWQKAHADQPPSPALCDRAEELGLTEFAAVLNLCRVRGWMPGRALGSTEYVWKEPIGDLLVDHMPETADFSVRSLLICYSKLLYIPYPLLEAVCS